MGKEHSKGSLPEVDGEAIEVTDSYVLRSGHLSDGTTVSVFSGAGSPALLTLANNLKTHRHPNIVKYVSSGQHDDRFYVVTERLQPLNVVLDQQSDLQICVGLHSIVSALTFLHKQAETSHNNVCCASIFVTPEGVWKLGGLEFMCKFSNTTPQSLRDLLPRRYEPAVPPEEKNGRVVPAVIDVFGLGVMITELLSQQTDPELPSLEDMIDFCKSRMLESDPRGRAQLPDVATHPFFSHAFIRIHRFLSELPLKTAEEKLEFFRELEQQLKKLPEEMVASQLLPLLLARLVVLETAAQQHLMPMLLRPKSETHQDALFTMASFRRHVVPKLLQMICVRDTSVRLLLLTHLPGFMDSFTREQLQTQLLPELLVGVKDESDELVVATLHALATLVGALGGAAVVGGRRARLFSDGRPATRRPRPAVALPERPSPDGGEDSIAEDTEAWSDWEQPQSEKTESEFMEAADEDEPIKAVKTPEKTWADTKRKLREPLAAAPTTLADIDALDIKSASGWRSNSGPDFFSDMEPVISRTTVAPVIAEDKFRVSDPGAVGDTWDSFEDWGEAS